MSVKAAELIKQIPSEFYRDSLSDKLANLLGKPRERTKAAVKRAPNRITPATMKITPMRRAIGLLLQYPHLVKVMPDAPELADADIPGINLLLAIQQRLQQEPGLTTAQLLEQWRDLPEHSILMTLAAWEHQIEPEQLSQEFIDTFYFIEDQYLQKQLDELALRAKLNQLSKAEWHKYNLLLQALKSKKPKLAT